MGLSLGQGLNYASRILAAPQRERAPAPWTPAQLGAAVVGWWDAQDAGTFTLNGSRVASWANKGSAGGVADQVNGAQQPVYSADVGDGRPGVIGDGSQALKISSQTGYPLGSAASTIAAVALTTQAGSGAYGRVFGYGGYDIANNRALIFYEDLIQGNISGFQIASAIGAIDTFRLAVWGLAGGSNPQASSLSIDGTAVTPVSLSPNTTDGDGYLFGRSYFGDWNLSGIIREVMLIDRDLTIDESQRIEGYFAWRWGLHANLPSGHTYKTEPPHV